MEYNAEIGNEIREKAIAFDINSLYGHMGKLEDQRKRRGVRYPLALALAMIILAKLGGEDGPKGMADWLENRIEFLTEHMKLSRPTVPHPVTISRILGKAVDVDQFEQVVHEFFTNLSGSGHSLLISMDGKTIRSTIPFGESRGTHLLALYLPEEGLTLMQMEVDLKENEIAVAPKILGMVDLHGKVVVGDALHTQRAVSAQIVEAGGNYCWTVKDNQPSLRSAIERFFEPEVHTPGFGSSITDLKTVQQFNKGHGRLETRTLSVCSLLEDELDWPYAQQVFKLQRCFAYKSSGKITQETVFGITSLACEDATPEQLLQINRGYWGIENGLHYRRDVTLKEDLTRVKIGHAPRVMAILNNLVLGLIARTGAPYVPEVRRRFSAHPILALDLIIHDF
jgi:predicted transposase YbfD/YdcC